MLTLAREARGLTQGELAERAKVTQGFVSKAEHGLHTPDPARLTAFARALNLPVEFFNQADTVYGYGSACVRYRKRQTLPLRQAKKSQALINMLRMQIERLLQGVEVQATLRFPRLDIDEYDSPSTIARLVRAHWRLPYGPIRNLMQVVEAAGGIVVFCSFDTRKLDAASQWPPGHSPFFFINEASPPDRQRWTLAHEIGHMVMHQWATTGDLEDQADEFAAELLMPAEEIIDYLRNLTLKRLFPLKAYWRVSMQALIMHAGRLGVVTQRQQRSAFSRLNELGYLRSEPVELEREEPSLVL